MKQSELINHIRQEVDKAALEKKKDAVNMYLVIKHAKESRHIDPVEFPLSIGRNESYSTKFKKGLRLASVIEERGL